jgi:hypothetical protein
MKKYLLLMMMGLFSLFLGSCKSGEGVHDMTVDQFEQFIAKPDVQLVDVRSAEEFMQGHLVGAVNIDVLSADFLDKATASLNKKQQVAVYCRSGRRSASAARQLSKAGFKVVNLAGGITDWQVAGKKVEK